MKTYFTKADGTKVPMYKILVGITGNLLCYMYVKQKFYPPQLNSFSVCDGSFMETSSGYTLPKSWLETMLSKMSEVDAIQFCSIKREPTNMELWQEFDNVPLQNPYMNIKWPVTKETNRLRVQATGSGWWLYYKNDQGEYEKAKKPDGSQWYVHSRIDGLETMFKLNGWSIPVGGFK